VLDLLALYDHDERFAATFSDTRREELAGLVRHVDLVRRSSSVLHSRLDASNVDAAIHEQMAYFRGLGHDLEWKAYAHDRPPDLVERLTARGFALDEPEAILVLDLESAPGGLLVPSPVDVRRVSRPEELQDIGVIRRQVYGEDGGDRVERLVHEVASEPDRLSVYVAYVDDTPAACGWIRYPTASAFASLWGGSTVPTMRGHGLYAALVGARIREARARGPRYLTVDARRMSRPILERRGFVYLTTATACTWSPER
jgi:GNAT superfamily N-acetyltransferase